MDDRRLRTVGRVLRATGAARAARALAPRDDVRVTITHSVAESDRASFAAIVDYVLSVRRALTPAEFFAALHERRGHGRPAVLLTFDDGLRSSLEAAEAVLDPRGVKAIFFVPTAILELRDEGDMREFAWTHLYHRKKPREALRPHEYVTMAADDLVRLHGRGHMVLPHTHTHVRLSDVADEQAADAELVRPRRLLEDLLGAPADSFAFPTGTERVVSPFSYGQVRRVYSSCFTGLNGPNTVRTDPYFLHRDCVHPYHDVEHVARLLGGSLDLAYALKMRRLRARVRPVPAHA